MNERKRRANALMMKYYSGLIDEGSWKTAAGNIAVFNTKYRRNLKSLVVQLEPIQAGSGDPSPDNIRPISGRTGATVYRTGKNLWKFESSYSASASGSFIPVDGTRQFALKAGTYTWSFNALQTMDTIQLNFRTEDNGQKAITFYVGATSGTGKKLYTFTLDEDVAVLRSAFCSSAFAIEDFQLELGTTATAYEPYTGTTIPVSWETEAGTVYGGELDVVSGELTVTWDMLVIDGTQNIRGNGRTAISQHAFLNVSGKAYGIDNMISNKFSKTTVRDKVGKAIGRPATNGVEFYLPLDGTENTDVSCKQWFTENPTQLCFELANPQTYQLTPQQIQTLLGDNVIWSDAGPISVEYWS